jgi:hypothetical protein
MKREGKLADWDDTWMPRWLLVSNGVVIKKRSEWQPKAFAKFLLNHNFADCADSPAV